MNGKEQIAAVLAHEVKNPVSLIKMNVQYIKDFCPKALENNFTVIEKELEKLNHIINDYTIMAENTRKENIEMIFIDELLSDIIEEYNLTPYDKKIEFVLDSPDDVKLYGDYNKINILFFNIYKNAIEAINNKGIIKIENMELGKYYFVEKESPKYYKLDNTKHYFEIKENGKIYDFNLENERILGNLEIIKKSNNLNLLNPETINNPSIYSLLTNKYYIASEKGITMTFNIFTDLSKINCGIYELTRILGILLDNAIEAAEETSEKIIEIDFRTDSKKQLFIIENSCINNNISTIKIFEKGYSTKENNSGIGLWKVHKILSKNTNLDLFTTIHDNKFRQQLEVFY